ncbi:unnamed protein product [Symbiodinium microadriaticum]|nr:unnamed protein product [Symbiodinium microadriaticum]
MASSVSAGSPQSLEQSYRASMKAMNLQRRQSVEEMPPFHVEEEEAAAEDPLETRDDDSVSDFWTSPDAVKNALNQLRSSE